MMNDACLTGEAHSDYTLTCRGVAQLAAHRVWDAGAGGSSPPTPTFLIMSLRSAYCRFVFLNPFEIFFTILPNFIIYKNRSRL